MSKSKKEDLSLEEKHAQYLKGGRWKTKGITPSELGFILAEIQEQKSNKK